MKGEEKERLDKEELRLRSELKKIKDELDVLYKELREEKEKKEELNSKIAVSYTHLTLPTN